MLARLAMEAGRGENARYGDITGDAALREALAKQTSTLYGGRIGADDVAITAGCNQAFFVAIGATRDRRWLTIAHEHAHSGDTEHATLRGELANGLPKGGLPSPGVLTR